MKDIELRGGSQILYCDEDKEMLANIGCYLIWYGFGVDSLGNSECVTELIEAGDYDLLIVSAWSLPLNGFTLCRKIRESSSKKVRNIRILMVAPEDLSARRFKWLKNWDVNFMTKYRGPEKWNGKVKAVLRQEEKG